MNSYLIRETQFYMDRYLISYYICFGTDFFFFFDNLIIKHGE